MSNRTWSSLSLFLTALSACTRPNPLYQVDAYVAPPEDAGLPQTCLELQAEGAESGTYTVDPGSGPVEVYCEMSYEGGGWTRVGYEAPGGEGTFVYLGVEQGDPANLLELTGNALIGSRFVGAYSEIMVHWHVNGGESQVIRGKPAEEVFKNEVNLAIPIGELYTNDLMLEEWVTAAGGAILCRASRSPDVRPGDTSWAFKPKTDKNSECGCSGLSWVGQGAYYGGSRDFTSCGLTPGGGWAGVRAADAPKSGILDNETEIFIR